MRLGARRAIFELPRRRPPGPRPGLSTSSCVRNGASNAAYPTIHLRANRKKNDDGRRLDGRFRRVGLHHSMPQTRLVRQSKNSQNHRVRTWPKSWQQVMAAARDFFRRHWQEMLQIREKLLPSEETVHL